MHTMIHAFKNSTVTIILHVSHIFSFFVSYIKYKTSHKITLTSFLFIICLILFMFILPIYIITKHTAIANSELKNKECTGAVDRICDRHTLF